MDIITNSTVIQEFYDDIAYDYANEWYNNNSFSDILKSFMALFPSSPKILDMGCGAGYHSMTLNSLGANVTGIDFSEKAIQIAREKNPGCHFEIMDFRNIGRDLGCFDGIISIAAFIHIPGDDLSVIFKQIKSVLKRNGYLLPVINEGSGESQFNFHSENNSKQYDFIAYFQDVNKLNELACKNGLILIDEWKLPEEHSSRGWKCYLYQLNIEDNILYKP